MADAAENKAQPNSEAIALRATHTVRGWLWAEPDLTKALAGASNDLHDRAVRLRQRNPLATVAVVDVDRVTGHATATRCADSEVWVKTRGVWEPVFPGDMLTEAARNAWEFATRGMTGQPPEDVWAVQERLLDDPDCWVTPALGFAAKPRPQTVALGVIDEVIVSTDGARLDPERCAELSGWLSHGIQQFPSADWPHPSPHGDLAVLHAVRG